MAPFIPKRSGVGVVEIFGSIHGGSQAVEQVRLLDIVHKARHMKALVVDIDSPGGAVSGSEVLYSRLERIARDKPVVAFVRGMGASGAYYISCATHQIVALPSSLVGSIGVIYLRPAIHDLMKRLGVDVTVYKGGRLKDMTGFWRGPTDEESEKFTGLIEEMHQSFIDTVAKCRSMEPQRVRELATGEVFTGRQARDLGLVDRLGDFDDALELAAEMAGVKPKPLWVRPKRGFMERVAGRFGHSMASGLVSQLEESLPQGLYYKAHWSGFDTWRR